MKKLLIISNMTHHERDGTIVGHGATVRELNHLATLFEEVRHVACLSPDKAPPSDLPYAENGVRLVPVPPAGGPGLSDKLQVFRLMALYARTILRELPRADVVHVRCPANISLLAIVLLALARKPRVRWIKYAGNWHPGGREALSYTFQRWWLNVGLARGMVTINGKWHDQPKHVRSFYNPSLTQEEMEAGREAAASKQVAKRMKIIFVGRLDNAKGAGRALEIVHALCRDGIVPELDMVGGGSQQSTYQRLADTLAIAHLVRFHGELTRTTLAQLYTQAHIVLLPSKSEGWPKVLSEAMAYGAVPVASAVGSIPDNLRMHDTGRAIEVANVQAFADAIKWYALNPERWKEESLNGVKAAHYYSYTYYRDAVEAILTESDVQWQT